MVSFMSRSLYLRYPLDRRLCGPQSRFGRGGKEKNSFYNPAENRISVVQPVASLYWQSYPGIVVKSVLVPSYWNYVICFNYIDEVWWILHPVQTGSEVHCVRADHSRAVKWPERGDGHSPRFGAKVKNALHTSWWRACALPKPKYFEIHFVLSSLTSREAGSRTAGQEILRLLWNPNVHFRVDKISPLYPLLNQMNRVHIVNIFSPFWNPF